MFGDEKLRSSERSRRSYLDVNQQYEFVAIVMQKMIINIHTN